MAAMTKRLLHLRPKTYSYRRLHPLHHFSSSSNPDPPSDIPQPKPDSAAHSSSSSNFDEVRASLQQEPSPQNRKQPPPRKPLVFSGRTPRQSPPPSRTVELNEIRQNLSEFRLRSAAPPPSSSGGGQYVSLQELFYRSVQSEGGGSATSSGDDPADRRKHSFNTVRESLNLIKSSARDSGGKATDLSSLARLRESLKLNPSPNSPPNIGGSYSFPSTLNSGKRGDSYFFKFNDYLDLGKKLKELRPEKRKGKWFSLHELNDRLTKVRDIEEKKSKELGVSFMDPRDFYKISKDEKSRNQTMQKLGILGHLGGTPSFMLSPPKEDLVEKYFHLDNMSAAEKLKLELKNVQDEFKMSESDCGSARVQVAQLTTKIKYLSNVLQKKDKHSRRGLQAMVQSRKKLLKYLRRTDWDSYCLVLSKLGLRDNPDVKA